MGPLNPQCLSPDGRWLVVLGPNVVLDLETGEAVHIARPERVGSDSLFDDFSWAPDSREFCCKFLHQPYAEFAIVSLPKMQGRAVRFAGSHRFGMEVSAMWPCFDDGGVLAVCVDGQLKGAPLVRASLVGDTAIPQGPLLPLTSGQPDYPTRVYRSCLPQRLIVVGLQATYMADLATGQVTRLLWLQRTAALRGHVSPRQKAGYDAVYCVGDVHPNPGGRWVYALFWPDPPNVVVRVDLKTGVPEKLGTIQGALPRVCPSPDGTRIAFAVRARGVAQGKAGSHICVSDPYLKRIRRLTSGKFADAMPVWNQAGGEILFVREYNQIWAVPIEGGEARKVWAAE